MRGIQQNRKKSIKNTMLFNTIDTLENKFKEYEDFFKKNPLVII
jgi:hypothetical protein